MQNNPFFNKGLSHMIDGIEVDEVENIMRKEINAILQRHETSTRILHKAAEIAPAMGLIGTLIGLVLMLGNLSDPTTIGPSMAVALLTTLYGAMLSYMVLTPLATKLERNTRDEARIMSIYLNSIASIGHKENPRRLEMTINATLPPSQRVKYYS
jgi:chemotaxis protein MotA